LSGVATRVNRADLRVGHLAALHRRAEQGQRAQGVCHADLLACRAEVDAGAPIQPIGARQEAVVPAGASVEFTNEEQQLVCGGVNPRRQVGNGVA
jgi:hypothetical protein